jgi:O-antigen/teichoic acid export membrane protein
MTTLITRLKTAFLNSRFANPESAFRHVSLIAGGTVIAQAIGILTIPIISRIYPPTDYGIMAVYASIIGILAELSGFRYHLAIPLPKDERYAKALVVLSLALQIVFVSLLAVLLFTAGEFLLTKLSMPQLVPYRGLIPLGLLATGTYLVLTQWTIRERLFPAIARTRVTQSLSGVLAKIGLGLLGVRPLGLLIGTIIAQGGGITTLLRSLLKKKGIPRPKKEDIRRVALRYRKFPMYSTWSGLLNTLGRQIVPILLIAFYDPKIAGLFAMAQSLLHLPAAFVGHAIGQVFLQRASVARYSGGLQSLSFKTYAFLLKLGFFPLMVISFFSPYLFAFILGERWIDAGPYARVLGPWIAFGFAYSPMSVLYSILDRQGIALLFEAAYILLRVFVFWLGTYAGSPLLSVGLYSITGFLVLVVQMFYLLITSGASFKLVFNTTARTITEAFLLLLFPVIVLYLNLGPVFVTGAILLVGLLYLLRNYKFFLSGGAP